MMRWAWGRRTERNYRVAIVIAVLAILAALWLDAVDHAAGLM